MRAPFLPDPGRILRGVRSTRSAQSVRLASTLGATVALALLGFACGAGDPPPVSPGPPPSAPPPPPPSVQIASAVAGALMDDAGAGDASDDAGEGGAVVVNQVDAASPSACPFGMALVDTTYCPKVRQRCKKDEYNKPNHITICHEFAPGQVCLTKPRRQRFCIDRYEYPNREGAHPPVMVSWYDAAAACGEEGKRLCWESEWVSACEGPEKLPFPYGLRRDATMCNIDNQYVNPHLDQVYSSVPSVQNAALLGLDQSVLSGEKPGCKSGFDVHDLTGNVDEWVNAEEEHKVSGWAGLKGGAWGHVRNACRPMTTSHPPDFTYYFISFRCCADAAPDASVEKDPSYWRPPPQHPYKLPGVKIGKGWTTTERGPNRPGKP
ncbi:MAG: SUMF1/EgtB/PvdO family nonheme iron enzyme [Byssovorax sp.]